MDNKYLKEISLNFSKLAVSIQEAHQSTLEFSNVLKSIRNRYTWLGWQLYKLGWIPSSFKNNISKIDYGNHWD